jgi:hypothetical protein
MEPTMRIFTCSVPALATLLCCVASAAGAAAESARPWLGDGSIGLSFRYRYEYVDEEAFAEDARASTLRSRLSLQSGTHRDLAFLIEVDDIREILQDDFNAGAGNTPGRSRFPVVADPEGTEVNQAHVDYLGLTDTRIRLGRQRINLDDQRFVGGVGWRQNEQTFDAVSVDWNAARGRIFYALVDNVNRVFGEDVPAGDHRQSATHLLNLSTDVGATGELAAKAKLTAYHYAIDNDDAADFSTRTTGLRLLGSQPWRDARLGLLLEYAHQGDLADNPVSYRADYWHVNVTAARNGWSLGLGWEVLDGDRDRPGRAFRTPLATLHAFNGWADQFLTTPDAGLDDRYLTLATRQGPWVAELRAHRFEAADGGARLADEIDLQVGRKLGNRIRIDLFAAAFDGRNGYGDVDKVWLMLTATF